MTIGEKLWTLRESEGFSRQRLADLSGVPTSSIRVYEIEEHEPSFPNAVRLAQTLGVSLDYLAGTEKTAYWKKEPGCGYIVRCSHCGNPDVKRANYCSCCGYKMVEEGQN